MVDFSSAPLLVSWHPGEVRLQVLPLSWLHELLPVPQPILPAGFRARAWRLLTACCVMFRTLRKLYGTLTSRQTSHQSKQLGRHTRPHTYKAPTFQPLARQSALRLSKTISPLPLEAVLPTPERVFPRFPFPEKYQQPASLGNAAKSGTEKKNVTGSSVGNLNTSETM